MRRACFKCIAAGLAVVCGASGALAARAAHAPGLAAPAIQPPADPKDPKAPPIDLEKNARQPREGQARPRPAPAAPPAPPPPAAAPPQPEPVAPPAPEAPRAAPPAPPAAPAAAASAPRRASANPLAALRADVEARPVELSALAVHGAPGSVQWRRLAAADTVDGSVEGTWSDLARGQGELGTGVFEVRTSVQAGADFEVPDSAGIAVDRLTRATIYQLAVKQGGDAGTAVRTVVGLRRGRVVIRPQSGQVTVRTPDWIIVVREPVEVAYDAAAGTRTRALALTAP